MDQAERPSADADKAVSLKPSDCRFLDMSGHILLALGDTKIASEDFIVALRIKCRQRFVVPERRSLIRDRNELKCLALYAPGSRLAWPG
jgi:hypothetical protein